MSSQSSSKKILRKDFVQSLGRDPNDKIYASAIDLSQKAESPEKLKTLQQSFVPETLQGKIKVKKKEGKRIIIVKKVVKRSR